MFLQAIYVRHFVLHSEKILEGDDEDDNENFR